MPGQLTSRTFGVEAAAAACPRRSALVSLLAAEARRPTGSDCTPGDPPPCLLLVPQPPDPGGLASSGTLVAGRMGRFPRQPWVEAEGPVPGGGGRQARPRGPMVTGCGEWDRDLLDKRKEGLGSVRRGQEGPVF